MDYMYYYFINEISTNQNRHIRTPCGNGASVVQTRYQDASYGNLHCTLTKTNIDSSLTLNSMSMPFPRDLVEDTAVKCAEQEKMFNKTAVEAGNNITVQTELLPPLQSQLRTKDGSIRRKRRYVSKYTVRARNLIKPTQIHEITFWNILPVSDTALPPVVSALFPEANTTGGEADKKLESEVSVGNLVSTVEGAGIGKRSSPQLVDHDVTKVSTSIERHHLVTIATTAEKHPLRLLACGTRDKSPF